LNLTLDIKFPKKKSWNGINNENKKLNCGYPGGVRSGVMEWTIPNSRRRQIHVYYKAKELTQSGKRQGSKQLCENKWEKVLCLADHCKEGLLMEIPREIRALLKRIMA